MIPGVVYGIEATCSRRNVQGLQRKRIHHLDHLAADVLVGIDEIGRVLSLLVDRNKPLIPGQCIQPQHRTAQLAHVPPRRCGTVHTGLDVGQRIACVQIDGLEHDPLL
jgi:hypothetical protein